MGREATTDFVLDTKGHCFLCMDPVSSPLIKLEPGDPPDLTSTYNVHYLTRLLKIDMGKVFTDKTSIPPQLLTKVQHSRLRTNLCDKCVTLSEKFSKLHRKLEKIKLEVDFCLGEISQKLMNATLKFEDISGREPNYADDLLKQEVAEVLRREATSQCTAMLSCPFPRIKVQNMTEEEIGTEVLKITSQSIKTSPTWYDEASNSSFESANEGLHDLGMEISKVKQERNSPNLAVDTEEGCDWDELYNYSRLDDVHDDVPEHKYAVPAKAKGSSAPETEIIPNPKSTTKTLTLGQLQNKSKIKLKGGSKKKNEKSFSGAIPPPIKIVEKIGTSQGQYNKNAKSGRLNCRLCPKSYSIYSHFHTHFKRIHLKEKVRCAICGIEYPYKQQYDLHYLNVHAGVRYHCKKCNRSFTQKTSLDRHNNSAHLGRRAFCKFCPKSFSESFDMKAHMRKCHSDKFDSQAPLK